VSPSSPVSRTSRTLEAGSTSAAQTPGSASRRVGQRPRRRWRKFRGARAGAARDRSADRKAAKVGASHSAPLTQRQLVKLVSRLHGCLSSVTARGRRLLTLRTGYGLKRSYDRTQVARILGVSRGRESQLEQQAVTGLQHAAQTSACARPPRQLSAIGAAAAAVPLRILQPVLGATHAVSVTTSSSQSGAAPHKRRARASRSASPPQAVNPTGSAGKSAVIGPPSQGGMDWLLLAVARAVLCAAAGAIAARRHIEHTHVPLESGTAATTSAGLLSWRTRRVSFPRHLSFPRRPRISPLAAALAALPALLPGRSQRRSRTTDRAPRHELAAPTTAPAGRSAPAEPAALDEPVTAAAGPAPAQTSAPTEPAAAETGLAGAAAAFALGSRLETEHDLHGAEDAYR